MVAELDGADRIAFAPWLPSMVSRKCSFDECFCRLLPGAGNRWGCSRS